MNFNLKRGDSPGQSNSFKEGAYEEIDAARTTKVCGPDSTKSIAHCKSGPPVPGVKKVANAEKEEEQRIQDWFMEGTESLCLECVPVPCVCIQVQAQE